MSVYPVCSLIKELRKRNGLTQADLSWNLCDCTTLSRIESGLMLPSAQLAGCLMQRLKAQQYFYIGNSTIEEIDFLKQQTRVLKEMENGNFEAYHDYMDQVSEEAEDILGAYEKQRHYFIEACFRERTGNGDSDDFVDALQITMPLEHVLGRRKRMLYFDQELLILLNIARLYAREGMRTTARRICERMYDFTGDDHYLHPVVCHYIICINYGTFDKMMPEIVPKD
ncbi:MAG: helix-turn-helix domain-containing protein [Lachnospiraceae bacterium]|nr:helix-turn-helix domain-containing protein [Lachnospiraceae bacterium]